MKTKQIFMIFCLFMVFISAMSFACAADDVGDTPINQATDAQDILTTDSGSFKILQ